MKRQVRRANLSHPRVFSTAEYQILFKWKIHCLTAVTCSHGSGSLYSEKAAIANRALRYIRWISFLLE